MSISKKTKLFWLVFFFITAVSFLVLKSEKKPPYRQGASSVYDTIVRDAVVLYRAAVEEGIDLSVGPCLTNDLRPGWVVDVVHSPREKVDDLPQNQCAAFREGRAVHFVELDTKGNIVRVR